MHDDVMIFGRGRPESEKVGSNRLVGELGLSSPPPIRAEGGGDGASGSLPGLRNASRFLSRSADVRSGLGLKTGSF